MYYLDANAFIYPALYDGQKSDGATALLRKILDGDESAATATLTVDEVVWILSREADRSIAIEQGRRILEMPNLRILDVEAEHALRALSTLDSYVSLTPRDAFHLAVMGAHGIHAIASDDRDFEEISEVDRHPLESFA